MRSRWPPLQQTREIKQTMIDLAGFPRIALAHVPTPIEYMARLSDALRGPRLFVKRDDCTGLAMGGNKTRKLEFLVGEALAQGADLLITVGAVQSNHVRQTAAAAAKVGLACEILLSEMAAYAYSDDAVSGNVLLDRILDARIHSIPASLGLDVAMSELAAKRRAEGRKPYLIPLGGASAIGSLGYVAAVPEMVDQARRINTEFDHIVLASSSGGTSAGLLVGLQAADVEMPVFAMCVYDDERHHEQKVRALAAKTNELLGIDATRFASARLICSDIYRGSGYGIPTHEMRDAVLLAGRHEGLLLDPVYTGKAMAGLIDLINKGRFRRSENVLFWHTGGTPALFAYGREFARI